MPRLLLLSLIYLATSPNLLVDALDPLSWAGSAATAGATGWALSQIWDTIKDSTVVRTVARSAPISAINCAVRECCQAPYLQGEFSQLRRVLRDDVHGQHLVANHLPRVIENHRLDLRSRKPLVISMHGTTGVGKNFVASKVAEAVFKYGTKSQFYHIFVGSMEFPHSDEASVARYARDLRNWVMGNLSRCEHSLFVFDEVDKIPGGVLDGLRSVMDFHGELRGVDISRATFLLLSNTGGKAVNSLMLRRFGDSLPRDSVTLDDFSTVIAERSFDEAGGLYKSDIISSALVDLYLPFLPLERRHVEMCVRDELKRRGVIRGGAEAVKHVLSRIRFDASLQVFARVGCKDVSNKVNLVVDISMFDQPGHDEH